MDMGCLKFGLGDINEMNKSGVNNYKLPWKILILAIVLNFCTWAFLFVTPNLETVLSADLFITHFQTSLLFTTPILIIALVAIPAGIIADKIGLKRAIGIGVIIVHVSVLYLEEQLQPILLYLSFPFLGLVWDLPCKLT